VVPLSQTRDHEVVSRALLGVGQAVTAAVLVGSVEVQLRFVGQSALLAGVACVLLSSNLQPALGVRVRHVAVVVGALLLLRVTEVYLAGGAEHPFIICHCYCKCA
jgi:hypothetical protein